MENRGHHRFKAGVFKVIVWWAWLIAIFTLSAEPFLWQVRYFRIHGNLLYFRAIIVILLLLIPACLFYVRWRRRAWYRYELPAIAAAALGLGALEQPLGLLVGALFFLASVTTGSLLFRLFGIPLESSAEKIGMGLATGAAAFIPVLFVLGLLHAYYWPVFLVLLLAPLVLAPRDGLGALRAIGNVFRAAGQIPALQHPLCGVAVVFLAGAVLCGTFVALAPSIIMDAVKMHLPDAQSYLAMHGLEPVPASSYSFYPQGFEVEVSALYALGGQPAARMITPGFFAALLLVLFEIARLCGFNRAGIFAGLAALVVTPFILWDGSQVKNDAELALFQLAALYCCLRWRATERRSWLFLGAFLLASSFGIKHVAAFGAVPLSLLFLAPLYRKPRAFRTAALFFLCIAVFGFYWHARTYLLTGDPFYPRQIDEAVVPKLNFLKKHESRVHRRVTNLWMIQLNDHRVGFESPLRSPLGIVLLVLAPLALLAARRPDVNRRACWFYAGLYLLLWASRMTTLRYALAPIALLIVLVVAKAQEAYEERWAISPKLARFSIAAALGGALAYGLLGAILVEIVPGQLPLLAHRLSRAAYLRANLPGYAAIASFARGNPQAAFIQVNSCGRAYAPDPVHSFCVSGTPGEGGERRVRKYLNSDQFQYAILPASWDAADCAALFRGWTAQQIFADNASRAFKIMPNP
jgi:Dolichyl-phosphate-mannose-protein mannosyltransferase